MARPRPVGVVLTALLSGVIAVGSAVTALTRAEDRTILVVVALFMGSVAVMLLAGLGGARRWSTTELDGSPAWRLRLGPPRRSAVAVTAVLAVVGLSAAYGAVVSLLDGRAALGILLAVLAVPALVLAFSMGQVALRDPALVLGLDRLVHSGAGVQAEVAWDDVGEIGWAHLDQAHRAAIAVAVVRGAPSLRVQRRPSLLPLDHGGDDAIELRVRLLDDAPSLLRLLRELSVGGRPTREALIARGLPADSGR